MVEGKGRDYWMNDHCLLLQKEQNISCLGVWENGLRHNTNFLRLEDIFPTDWQNNKIGRTLSSSSRCRFFLMLQMQQQMTMMMIRRSTPPAHEAPMMMKRKDSESFSVDRTRRKPVSFAPQSAQRWHPFFSITSQGLVTKTMGVVSKHVFPFVLKNIELVNASVPFWTMTVALSGMSGTMGGSVGTKSCENWKHRINRKVKHRDAQQTNYSIAMVTVISWKRNEGVAYLAKVSFKFLRAVTLEIISELHVGAVSTIDTERLSVVLVWAFHHPPLRIPAGLWQMWVNFQFCFRELLHRIHLTLTGLEHSQNWTEWGQLATHLPYRPQSAKHLYKSTPSTHVASFWHRFVRQSSTFTHCPSWFFS